METRFQAGSIKCQIDRCPRSSSLIGRAKDRRTDSWGHWPFLLRSARHPSHADGVSPIYPRWRPRVSPVERGYVRASRGPQPAPAGWGGRSEDYPPVRGTRSLKASATPLLFEHRRRIDPIGIGGRLAAPPSHTTVRTGPYTAVRLV